MDFNSFIDRNLSVFDDRPRLLSREDSQKSYYELQTDMQNLMQWINQGNLQNQVNSLGYLIYNTMATMREMGIDVNGVMEEISKGEGVDGDGIQGVPDISEFCETQNEIRGIVVLEGTDCSGKTTLAKEIQEQFGGSIIHHTWTPELEKNYDKYMFNSFTEIIGRSKHELVIVDRAWISEYLYAKIYRDGTKWPNIQAMISSTLNNLNALNIYCRVKDYEAHSKRFEESKEKGEELYDDVEKITKTYNTAWDVGIQGLGDGSPVRRWKNYIEYSIEDNGDDLENFVYLTIIGHF